LALYDYFIFFFVIFASSMYKIMDTETTTQITGNNDITFNESHPVHSSPDYVVTSVAKSSFANQMAMPEGFDKTGSITDNLSTEVLIKTIQWTTSQTSDQELLVMNFPIDYFAAMQSTFTTALLRNYAYLRWRAIELSVKINSTKFHAGLLRLFSTPMRTRSAAGGGATDFEVALNNVGVLPGEWIFANAANSICHTASFNNINHFLPLRSDTFGQSPEFSTLRFFVRNVVPLRTASSSSPSCTLSFFMRFIDPIVAVRSVDHPLPLPVSDYDIEYPQHQSSNSAIGAAVGGAVQAFACAESGDILGAISGGVKAVGGVATLIDNLDKPIYHNYNSTTLRTTAPITHGSGAENSINMGLSPADTHELPKDLLSSIDEMNLLHIAQTYGIARILPWAASATPGTAIANIPLNYMYAQWTSQPTYDAISFTPLSLVASRFKVAKGGIKLRFTIIASSIHQGRLVASFHPHTTAPEANIKSATSVKNLVMDFSESKRTFEWVVPYYFTRSWCGMNWSKADIYNFNDSGTGAGGYGRVVLTIANELTYMDAVATDVSVMVEVAGASDIDFAYPSEGWPHNNNTAPTDLIHQSETVPAVDFGPPETSAAKSSTSVISFKKAFHGDTMETHLKSLLRRYCCIELDIIQLFAGPGASPDYGGYQMEWPNTPVLDMLWRINPVNQYRFPESNLAFFSCCYAFWSGPLRYKLITSTSTSTSGMTAVINYDPDTDFAFEQVPLIGAAPYSPLARQYFNMPTELVNLTRTPAIEFEIPYMSEYIQLLTVDGDSIPTFDSALTSNGTISFNTDYAYGTGLPKFTMYTLQSAGDSFTLMHFLGSPYFKLPPGSLDLP
jgi:hypothetical protein